MLEKVSDSHVMCMIAFTLLSILLPFFIIPQWSFYLTEIIAMGLYLYFTYVP